MEKEVKSRTAAAAAATTHEKKQKEKRPHDQNRDTNKQEPKAARQTQSLPNSESLEEEERLGGWGGWGGGACKSEWVICPKNAAAPGARFLGWDFGRWDPLVTLQQQQQQQPPTNHLLFPG